MTGKGDGNAFLGLFYKAPTDEAGEESAAPSRVASPVIGSDQPAVSAISTSASVTGTVNQEDEQSLLAAMAQAKKRGFEEFKELLSTIAETIPDEQTAITVALKTATKVHKLSQAMIAEAIQERLAILASENDLFAQSLDQDEKEFVEQRNNILKEIDIQVKQKRQQIAKLEEEITSLTGKGEKANQEIAGLQSQKAKRLADFKAAFDQHHNELTMLLNKISAVKI